MKDFKKRWLALLLFAAMAVFGVIFVACNKSNVDANDERVAITVVNATEGETLAEYMEGLQENGELTFTVSNGMVTAINGVSQTTNIYWMLYTSDTDNANTAWGTYEYDGQQLGSATLGAETLTVKDGCVYVWVYTKF
ncbi:MAG: hypothetical protein ACI4MC_02620 [Candidatus Coproplasma sp.]